MSPVPRPRAARARSASTSRRRCSRAPGGLPGVELALGDAEELAYEDDAFDAAVAAFLLHHVPSPERVVTELARVARRVAVAQWDAGERARLIGLLTDAIATAGVEPPTGRPVGPSRERLARDEELRRLFEDAGLADVRVDTVAFVEPLRNTDELWEGVVDGSVNTRAIVLAQPPEVQSGSVRSSKGSWNRTGTTDNPRARFRAHRVGPARLSVGSRHVVGVVDDHRAAGTFAAVEESTMTECL